MSMIVLFVATCSLIDFYKSFNFKHKNNVYSNRQFAFNYICYFLLILRRPNSLANLFHAIGKFIVLQQAVNGTKQLFFSASNWVQSFAKASFIDSLGIIKSEEWIEKLIEIILKYFLDLLISKKWKN